MYTTSYDHTNITYNQTTITYKHTNITDNHTNITDNICSMLLFKNALIITCTIVISSCAIFKLKTLVKNMRQMHLGPSGIWLL